MKGKKGKKGAAKKGKKAKAAKAKKGRALPASVEDIVSSREPVRANRRVARPRTEQSVVSLESRSSFEEFAQVESPINDFQDRLTRARAEVAQRLSAPVKEFRPYSF